MTAIDDMIAKYAKEEHDFGEKMIQLSLEKFYNHISTFFGEEVTTEVKQHASNILYDLSTRIVRFRLMFDRTKTIFVTIDNLGLITFTTDEKVFYGSISFPKALICARRAYEEIEYINNTGINSLTIPYDGEKNGRH